MSGRLPYIKRRKYPHMMGEDALIWDRFITEYPDRFDTVDYDWRVGEGMPINPEWEESFARMAKMITQKRIDVIGWNGDKPTIIEVKKRVGLSALGQVLGYRTLFTQEFVNFPDPELLVVTENIGIDDMNVLKSNGIPVVVV